VVARFPSVSGFRAIVNRIDERDTFVLELAAPVIPDGLAATLREVLHVHADLALASFESLNGESGKVVDRRTWDQSR
jgi:hypothetical protein